MTTTSNPPAKKPFFSISAEIDDDVLERVAQAKGVPSLNVPQPTPAPDPVTKPKEEFPESRRSDPKPSAGGKGETAAEGISPRLQPSAIKQKREGVAADSAQATPRERRTFIRAAIPDYALRELNLRIIDQGGTINYYILLGLKQLGIPIREADLIVDGRRLRGTRTR